MNQTTKLLCSNDISIRYFNWRNSCRTASPIHQEAQAATTPYYTYHGYIGHNANFIMDKHFINAIKYDNVTFNGIKLAKTNATKK